MYHFFFCFLLRPHFGLVKIFIRVVVVNSYFRITFRFISFLIFQWKEINETNHSKEVKMNSIVYIVAFAPHSFIDFAFFFCSLFFCSFFIKMNDCLWFKLIQCRKVNVSYLKSKMKKHRSWNGGVVKWLKAVDADLFHHVFYACQEVL